VLMGKPHPLPLSIAMERGDSHDLPWLSPEHHGLLQVVPPLHGDGEGAGG
jgi:hypothetical protein